MSENQNVKPTQLEGVFEVQRPTFPDDRGFFRESVRIKELESFTHVPFNVVQANHARSTKGALRGIHIAPWNKLIYVVRGKVQVVLVDCKEGSSTFGHYQSFIIGDDNKSSIFVPAGVGNSYYVMSDEVDYSYLTDQEWAPGLEKALAWDDPKLGIKWELDGDPILSEKDKQNPTFDELFKNR